MRHGISLFTSDRGIRPARAAAAAEERGFSTFYVPEHTHIPVRREAAHPATGGAALPDDRYRRTLDPWVALATAAEVTSTIELSTSVALPVESDPITLAKTIASVDFLSGGRVSLGAGFGWNLDELADHGIDPRRRRAVLADYLGAMRALWTQEVAAYDGEFIRFDDCWAWPKPAGPIAVFIGAQAGPRTFAWIAQHADGWVSTPLDDDLPARAAQLRDAWAEAGRDGVPGIRAHSPTMAVLDEWRDAGIQDVVWPLPDAEEPEVLRHLDLLARDLELTPPVQRNQ